MESSVCVFLCFILYSALAVVLEVFSVRVVVCQDENGQSASYCDAASKPQSQSTVIQDLVHSGTMKLGRSKSTLSKLVEIMTSPKTKS